MTLAVKEDFSAFNFNYNAAHYSNLKNANGEPLCAPENSFYRTRSGRYFFVYPQCNGFACACLLGNERKRLIVTPNDDTREGQICARDLEPITEEEYEEAKFQMGVVDPVRPAFIIGPTSNINS